MPDRDQELFINDIVTAITNIEVYIGQSTFEDFSKDKKTIDAVLRNLEVIGEASRNISKSLRDQFKEIEWKGMMGMRDKVIHGYFGIDLSIVWETVTTKLLPLRDQLNSVREALET